MYKKSVYYIIEKSIFMKINKNIIGLWFVSFFTDLASSMTVPLIPIYIVYILNQNIEQLWYVVAITTFVSYIFRIWFGYLADKYRLTKLFLVLWYTISAISKPLFYFTNSWQWISIVRSSERLWKAIRAASKDSVISRYAKKNKWWVTFWFHKMMDVFWEFLWAFLLFLILYYVWYNEEIIKNIFIFTAVPWVLAIITVIFFVEDAPYKTKKSEYKFNKKDYKLFPIILTYLFFLFFIFNDSFLLIQAKEIWYEIYMLPLFIVVLNLVQVLISYFSWLKIDKFWSVNVLFVSFVFWILTQISLYFNFIWVSFLLLWIFTILSINSIRTYISDNAENKSTMYWIFYAWVALTTSLWALFVSYMWNNYGVVNSILITLIWMIITLIMWFMYNKKLIK